MDFNDYVNKASLYRNAQNIEQKRINALNPDINKSKGLAESMFSTNPSLSYMLEDKEEYRKYGITPNRIDTNLNEQLADAQGFFSKLYNSVARTLVSARRLSHTPASIASGQGIRRRTSGSVETMEPDVS